MKRGILSSFLALLLTLLLCCGAAAEGVQPVIQDEAELLTEAEEATLAESMLPLCEYGTPIFWSTRQSGNFRTKAENFYLRQLGNDSGILFVIDLDARQLTILTNGAILRVVTPAEADTIADNVFRMASREEYLDCAKEVFVEAYRLLRGEQIARPMKLVSNILLALTLALLFVYLYISRRYETRPETGRGKAAMPVTAMAAAAFTATLTNGNARMTKQQRINLSSSSHGGHGGGGGGHGGGGGGFSGGGGSHGF